MEPPCRDLLQPWELAEECQISSYVLATMGLTKTCSGLSVLLPASPHYQRLPRHSLAKWMNISCYHGSDEEIRYQ